MSGASPHERALAVFELDDVFVIDLRCNVLRDFNQSALRPEAQIQHRFSARTQGLVQARKLVDSDTELLICRYYVDGGVRFLRPGVEAESYEFKDEDVLANIEGTIAVDYRASTDIREDVEAISAFSTQVVFHAWPYWRAIVTCRAAEMRLPRVVLPMMRQAKKTVIALQSVSGAATSVKGPESPP